MRRVLFVDDEANILAGLKRTMRSMRNEWDMEFIDDSELALEAFSRDPFDIVVSDMKMPKMDGADLLKEVMRLHPESIRIILSGHSDPGLVMKSVGAAHQYLAKPCEPEELKTTINRAYALKELVGNDALQQLVSGLGELPILPSAYREIVDCLQDPDASLADIGSIIGKDVGMTAKILQLVNSSFFGIASPVAAIDKAVSFLGLETIGTLVLAHGVFSHHEEIATRGFDIEALWSYSGRCAAMAKIVAKKEGMDSKIVDQAFLGGMLHDVGRLVLASAKTEEYASVLQRAGGQSGFPDEMEREVLGATHGEVGAYLVGLWGLPDTIVEAVAYHETPSQCHASNFGVFGVVHVASRLALNTETGDPGAEALHVDLEYLEKAGVVDRWPVWQAACQVDLQEEEHAA